MRLSESSQLTAQISAKVIQSGDPSTDILQLTKFICDETGYVHRFSTFISTYDLWNEISSSIAYLKASFLKSSVCPRGAKVQSLARDLNIFTDGRGERVFGIVTEPTEHPLLFLIREKYFSAKVDLQIRRHKKYTPSSQPCDCVFAIVTVFQPFEDNARRYELSINDRIVVPIPSSMILFDNYWHEAIVEEELTWVASPVPEPIWVKKTGRRGKPQPGVIWMKE